MLLISSLISLARTSSSVSNRSDSWEPCLVPNLEEEFSAFYQQVGYKLWAHGIWPFYVEIHSSYSYFVETLNHEKMLSFVKCFSECTDVFKWFLAFTLLVQYITFIIDVCAEPSLYMRDKSHLIFVYNYFNLPLHYICWWFWGFLHLCSSGILVYNFFFYSVFGF
jgi:hypothetical protein